MDCSALVKSYTTLTATHQLRSILNAFFQTDEFHNSTKYELIKIINDTVLKNYDGEQVLKYKLASYFRSKKNYVSAFEVKARNSRTDFLAINGNTKSFEIKSKIDTLSRLEKQISDYGDVFEYNTIVIDKTHLHNVVKIAPEYYGIWFYQGKRKFIYREAQHSPNLDAKAQLTLFNKKELIKSFRTSELSEILISFNSQSINKELKETLKRRYNDRWSFLQSNWETILPIDMQFFFNTNLNPKLVYEV